MTSVPIKTELFQKDVHAGYTAIAKELNDRFPHRDINVTRQQVHIWFTRRERNGFPPQYPVLAPSGKIKNLFHLNEVVTWYAGYKPSRKNRKATVDNSTAEQ